MDPVPDSDVTISECLCNFPYVELNICVCIYTRELRDNYRGKVAESVDMTQIGSNHFHDNCTASAS